MKNFAKYTFYFLLIFFLGILTERFNIDNKVSNFFKNIIDKSSRIIYSFKSQEKLEIFIEPKEYNKLLESRELALSEGILQEKMQVWAKAKLKNKDSLSNIKIRIKGVFPDHWSDSKQWSFKIRVMNDSEPYENYNRFNLQTPQTSSFMYEWILMKALEKEGLISLGTKYYDLIINGSSRGVYMIQGSLSDEILELNQRDPGPIIGFSKNLFLKEYPNSKRLNKQGATGSLNGIEDSFWRSKIEPTQFSNKNIGKIEETHLKKAIYLLESFRNGEKKPSEVFVVNKLAKVMALRALLGSSEFDYRDTKFYYNPSLSLLEPITKESHVDLNLNFEDHYFSWWLDSSNIKPHRPSNKNFFLDILYNDYDFYQIYLSELHKLSKIKYFENLIQENKKEFKKYLKIQKINYPTKKVFSIEQLRINRLRIQDLLNPVQGLNVYFLEYNNGILNLDISNLQRLPIKILGLEFKNNKKILLKKPFILKGKIPQHPLVHQKIKIDCLFKEECKKLMISKQKVLYQVLGSNKTQKAEISMFYFKSE